MTAIERWREMIFWEHAQSDSMTPEPREADFWTPYARNFRTDPRREGDELLDFLLPQVTPEDTLIDVGAGGGRLALPLALHCRRVVAVEPSPSMCAVLRETAAEHNIDNVSLVESDWLNATVEQAEIVLCSHVVYAVQDIGPLSENWRIRLAGGCWWCCTKPRPSRKHTRYGGGSTARHVCLFPAFRNSKKCWRKWASVPPSVLFPASRREGSTAWKTQWTN